MATNTGNVDTSWLRNVPEMADIFQNFLHPNSIGKSPVANFLASVDNTIYSRIEKNYELLKGLEPSKKKSSKTEFIKTVKSIWKNSRDREYFKEQFEKLKSNYILADAAKLIKKIHVYSVVNMYKDKVLDSEEPENAPEELQPNEEGVGEEKQGPGYIRRLGKATIQGAATAAGYSLMSRLGSNTITGGAVRLGAALYGLHKYAASEGKTKSTTASKRAANTILGSSKLGKVGAAFGNMFGFGSSSTSNGPGTIRENQIETGHDRSRMIGLLEDIERNTRILGGSSNNENGEKQGGMLGGMLGMLKNLLPNLKKFGIGAAGAIGAGAIGAGAGALLAKSKSALSRITKVMVRFPFKHPALLGAAAIAALIAPDLIDDLLDLLGTGGSNSLSSDENGKYGTADRAMKMAEKQINQKRENDLIKKYGTDHLTKTEFKNANKIPQETIDMIEREAASAGISSVDALKVLNLENPTADPLAVSPTGALGMFQLTKDFADRYKVKDRTDPVENTRGMMKGWKDIKKSLTKDGYDPTFENMYLYYQQGEAGGKEILDAAKSGTSVSIARQIAMERNPMGKSPTGDPKQFLQNLTDYTNTKGHSQFEDPTVGKITTKKSPLLDGVIKPKQKESDFGRITDPQILMEDNFDPKLKPVKPKPAGKISSLTPGQYEFLHNSSADLSGISDVTKHPNYQKYYDSAMEGYDKNDFDAMKDAREEAEMLTKADLASGKTQQTPTVKPQLDNLMGNTKTESCTSENGVFDPVKCMTDKVNFVSGLFGNTDKKTDMKVGDSLTGRLPGLPSPPIIAAGLIADSMGMPNLPKPLPPLPGPMRFPLGAGQWLLNKAKNIDIAGLFGIGSANAAENKQPMVPSIQNRIPMPWMFSPPMAAAGVLMDKAGFPNLPAPAPGLPAPLRFGFGMANMAVNSNGGYKARATDGNPYLQHLNNKPQTQPQPIIIDNKKTVNNSSETNQQIAPRPTDSSFNRYMDRRANYMSNVG